MMELEREMRRDAIILLLQSLNFSQAVQEEGSTKTKIYYIQDKQIRAIFGSNMYNPVNQKFEEHAEAEDQPDEQAKQAADQADLTRAMSARRTKLHIDREKYEANMRSSGYAQETEQVEETGNKRYIIADGKVKQPIFGSKKYNPVIQQFESPNNQKTPAPYAYVSEAGSVMETMSEHLTAPEISVSTPWPGITSPESSWVPSIEAVMTTVAATLDSLRGQATMLWWQKTTKQKPILKDKPQKKVGKKKSRRDDIETSNNSTQIINEIN